MEVVAFPFFIRFSTLLEPKGKGGFRCGRSLALPEIDTSSGLGTGEKMPPEGEKWGKKENDREGDWSWRKLSSYNSRLIQMTGLCVCVEREREKYALATLGQEQV